MKVSILDGRQRHKRALLSKLGRDLDHPEPIPNFDALYDVLTTDVKGPIRIVWRTRPVLRAELGPDYDTLLDVLERAAKHRRDLEIEVEELR
ncbi:MAG: barstar family protein [Geminicoccaceae bacterium]